MSEGMETIERRRILKEWLKVFMVLVGWFVCYNGALIIWWQPIIEILQRIGEDKSTVPHHINPQTTPIFVILIGFSLSALILSFDTLVGLSRKDYIGRKQRIEMTIFLVLGILLWLLLLVSIPFMLLSHNMLLTNGGIAYNI
jgi:sRNA-binding regulator protein Hfq